MNDTTKKNGVTPIPVSVDIVLLTVKDGKLHVALAPRQANYRHGELALIGGTINSNTDEHLGETVERLLHDRGGLSDIFMEQLYTFGSRTRDERGWSLSVSYYALIPMHLLEKTSKHLEYYPVDELPSLPFEHNRIIGTAVYRVRGKGGYSTIPARLLNENFTLTEMREVYEAVLGVKLNVNSFNRKVIAQGIVREIGEKTKNNSTTTSEGLTIGKRPATLYTLNKSDVNLIRSIATDS